MNRIITLITLLVISVTGNAQVGLDICQKYRDAKADKFDVVPVFDTTKMQGAFIDGNFKISSTKCLAPRNATAETDYGEYKSLLCSNILGKSIDVSKTTALSVYITGCGGSTSYYIATSCGPGRGQNSIKCKNPCQSIGDCNSYWDN